MAADNVAPSEVNTQLLAMASAAAMSRLPGPFSPPQPSQQPPTDLPDKDAEAKKFFALLWHFARQQQNARQMSGLDQPGDILSKVSQSEKANNRYCSHCVSEYSNHT